MPGTPLATPPDEAAMDTCVAAPPAPITCVSSVQYCQVSIEPRLRTVSPLPSPPPALSTTLSLRLYLPAHTPQQRTPPLTFPVPHKLPQRPEEVIPAALSTQPTSGISEAAQQLPLSIQQLRGRFPTVPAQPPGPPASTSPDTRLPQLLGSLPWTSSVSSDPDHAAASLEWLPLVYRPADIPRDAAR